MVLGDASPQANDSYASPDQERTYTPGHIPIRKYPHLVVKTELLVRPDPFTLYFGFFGNRNWQRKAALNLSDRVDNTKFYLNRPPTQDELDAFTQYSSQYIYHQRVGAPVVGAVFLARSYMQARGSATLRVFVPGLAEGARPTARQLVDAVRTYAKVDAAGFRQAVAVGTFKWFLWVLAGSSATSLWAMFHDTRESMSDPRLQQFLTEMRQQNPEDVRKRRVDAAVERSRQRQQERRQRDQGVSEMDSAQGVFAESHEHDQGGGAYGSPDPYSSVKQSVPIPSSSSPDKPARLPDRNLPRLFGDPAKTESIGGATTVDENKAMDFFDSDDASPVASEYRSDGLSSPQGSAWDRIRQQSGAGALGRQDSRPGSSTQWGSWKTPSSGPSTDSERQQRDEAQANFDRMLEAERNLGRDSSEKRGW